jgi:hypothetical protein
MTLVASIMFDNVPILMGDILVSSETDRGQDVHIPTVGNKNVASKYKASNLTQKLIIINDYLVVGWAGSLITAKTIIRD